MAGEKVLSGLVFLCAITLPVAASARELSPLSLGWMNKIGLYKEAAVMNWFHREKMGLALLAGAVGLLGLLGAPVSADEDVKSITGYIRDSKCFLQMDGQGEKHRKCAMDCGKAGMPMVLEEAGTGKLWLILPKEDKQNPNDQTVPYAEHKVTITGPTVTEGGLSAIELDKIIPAK